MWACTVVADGRDDGGEHDKVLQVREAVRQLVQVPGAHRLGPDCPVPALAVLRRAQTAPSGSSSTMCQSQSVLDHSLSETAQVLEGRRQLLQPLDTWRLRPDGKRPPASHL